MVLGFKKTLLTVSVMCQAILVYPSSSYVPQYSYYMRRIVPYNNVVVEEVSNPNKILHINTPLPTDRPRPFLPPIMHNTGTVDPANIRPQSNIPIYPVPSFNDENEDSDMIYFPAEDDYDYSFNN